MERGSRSEIPPSRYFAPVGGELGCDGASLSAIAATFGTPTHVYAARAIDDAYGALDRALGSGSHRICYAMKANGHPAIVRRLGALGAGVDAVSGGELTWARRSGIAADRIVMSGVGKTDAEIGLALDLGIRAIHVESEAELEVVAAAARVRRARAPIALRINPDVDAATHPYLATGVTDTKFGIDLSTARRLLPGIVASSDLALEAVACHIGSQIPSAAPLEAAVAIAAGFARQCAEAGAPIRALDAGGGWPIAYGDEDAPLASWGELAEALRAGVRRGGAGALNLELLVEPGRALVGDAGALLTRVLYVKEQAGKRFVVVDAAMTELVRPALYGAYHAIVPVRSRPGASGPADVVGPVCETGDFLAQGRMLGPVERGDLLLVRGTGAYGASMASRYNLRPSAAEVMVEAAVPTLISPRGRVEDLFPG